MSSNPDINLDLIKKVLGSSFLALKVTKLDFSENLVSETTEVSVRIDHPDKTFAEIKGTGKGLVDALFKGLLSRYAEEYESLKSIRLDTFSAGISKEPTKESSGVDAAAQITLGIKNSEGTNFAFFNESLSLVSSTVRVVVSAVEYFVNAERAFVTLHAARKDARERRREDLVTRYTAEIAEVVKCTSYAEVIEKMKSES